MGVKDQILEELVSHDDLGMPRKFRGMEVRLSGVSSRYARSRWADRSFLLLQLGDPIAVTTLVRRVTPWLRLARSLGLYRRIPSGDPEFDRLHHVECDDADYARELLSSRKRRAAIVALLDGPPRAVAVGLNDSGAVATFPAGTTIGKAQWASMLPQLLELRLALPDPQDRRRAFRNSQRRRIGYVIGFLVLSLCFVFAAVLMDRPTTPGMSLVPALATGGGVGFVGLLVGLLGLRGKSAAASEFQMLLLLLAVVSVWAGIMGREVAAELNAHRDTSPPVVHVQSVVRKLMDRRYDSSDYPTIFISPWNPGDKPLSLVVSQSEFDSIPIGRPVVIVSHAGAYGWEWIDPVDWSAPPPAAPAP